MQQFDSTISLLRMRGFRITPIRKAIIMMFYDYSLPLTPTEVIAKLSDQKIRANKTTVYREIDFLLQQAILQSVQLGDGSLRYEPTSTPHHHHLICKNCGTIDDIVLENDLTEQEEKITHATKFKILDHSLEFFGLCYSCQMKI